MLKRIFLYLAKKRLNRVDAVELEKIEIAEGPYICGTPIINFVHLEKGHLVKTTPIMNCSNCTKNRTRFE